MSGIQPGDVVICVSNMRASDTIACQLPYLGALKRGRLYRVAKLVCNGAGIILDDFDHGPDSDGVRIERFRKIVAADDQFIAQIRALKREPV